MVKIDGGAKLKAFMEKLATQKAKVDVGFFSGAHYEDGTSVVRVAIANEYGMPENNQPPRPFMQQTFNKYSGSWKSLIAKAITQYDYRMGDVLELMGKVIQGEIEDTISTGDFAPNAPATIAAKGKDTPLMDTLLMHNSVTYNVKK